MRAIFCDISKAFDRVWHKGHFYELSFVGISESLLQCFTDYLDNIKQRVVLPGTASSWTFIKVDVPQGSILGPLLFLVYTNYIVENIHSSIRLLAVDTSLYIIVDDPIDAANQINDYLQKYTYGLKHGLCHLIQPNQINDFFKKKKQTMPSSSLYV